MFCGNDGTRPFSGMRACSSATQFGRVAQRLALPGSPAMCECAARTGGLCALSVRWNQVSYTSRAAGVDVMTAAGIRPASP